MNYVYKITDNGAKVVHFADNSTITVTTSNQRGQR